MLTSKQQEQKSKQRKIRNSEYYDMVSTFDELYADSKKQNITICGLIWQMCGHWASYGSS